MTWWMWYMLVMVFLGALPAIVVLGPSDDDDFELAPGEFWC